MPITGDVSMRKVITNREISKSSNIKYSAVWPYTTSYWANPGFLVRICLYR